MAIDSREKRAGAAGLHFMPQLPVGDGTIAQADRQQVVGVYPGVLAAAAVIVAASPFRRARRMTGTLGRGEHFNAS